MLLTGVITCEVSKSKGRRAVNRDLETVARGPFQDMEEDLSGYQTWDIIKMK